MESEDEEEQEQEQERQGKRRKKIPYDTIKRGMYRCGRTDSRDDQNNKRCGEEQPQLTRAVGSLITSSERILVMDMANSIWYDKIKRGTYFKYSSIW